MTRSPEDTRPPAGERSGADHSGRRWTPFLLSLLVFPGLGQLALKRPWRGLAFAAVSVAALVLLVRRVFVETTRLLPEDPAAVLDPALPFRLAVEVHRANAAFFGWITLVVLAAWAASAVDAWLAPRGARPPGGGPRGEAPEAPPGA